MVFFMLSGYWVAKMQDGPHHQPYLTFIFSRFLRLWPLLAVATLLAVAVFAVLGMPSRGSLLSSLVLLGLASRAGDVLGVVWSLDIEAQFYILLPCILWAKPLIGSRLRLCVVASAALALGVLLKAILGINTAFLFMPMFLLGVSFYLLNYRSSGRAALVSLSAGVAGLALINSITLPDYIQPWKDVLVMADSLLLAPFVAWNVREPSGTTDRLLGNLSYPFYLVHYPSIRITGELLGPGLVAKFSALVLSSGLTGLLYVLVDRPVEKMRASLNKKRPTPAPQVAPV
jgi:peptidoglycan/LPS O-acetylase OafA/YrhL